MTLAGRRVVVTRSRPQASALAERLAARGAEVVELPVIAVVDPTDGGAALDAAMKSAPLSIKRKIITVTMLTSVIVLLVAVGAFMSYDLVTFRESMRRRGEWRHRP